METNIYIHVNVNFIFIQYIILTNYPTVNYKVLFNPCQGNTLRILNLDYFCRHLTIFNLRNLYISKHKHTRKAERGHIFYPSRILSSTEVLCKVLWSVFYAKVPSLLRTLTVLKKAQCSRCPVETTLKTTAPRLYVGWLAIRHPRASYFLKLWDFMCRMSVNYGCVDFGWFFFP